MPDFLHALQNGGTSLWLFIPAAILLGALHGLEPGHSKTMMAAFIIAIRGTVGQAVLLGLSAAISHSLLIWLLAAAALSFGNQWEVDRIEPYLQVVSAVLILGLATWMFFRTRREVREAAEHRHQHHHHGHSHSHGGNGHGEGHEHSHEEIFQIETGSGPIDLSVFEEGVPPVFRLSAPAGEVLPSAEKVSLETVRPDGTRQSFGFADKGEFLESRESIPEPHEFEVILNVASGGNGEAHTSSVEFREHAHEHGGEDAKFEDAHEREHANEIATRFAGRAVTTPQIFLFGITGGLMPCPAAFTVLLVCLQLNRVTLGLTMVAAFSFGLALTMVSVGALAALSVQHAQKKLRGFGEAMRRAPYVSCALLVLLAVYMAWHGWRGISAGA